MTIGAQHVVELGHAFRQTVLGAATTWPLRALGPLAELIVMPGATEPRADALPRVREALGSLTTVFATVATPVNANAHPTEIAEQVAAYWAVHRYPARLGNTDERRVKGWIAGIVAPDASVLDEAGAIVARQQASDCREAEEVRAGGRAPVFDRAAVSPTSMPIAFWDIREADNWPAGAEGDNLVDQVIAGLGDLPHALVAESPLPPRTHYRQILRRRARELHTEYLRGVARTPDVHIHFRHLVARPWFKEDLLELDRAAIEAEQRDPSRTNRLARAQAAVCALLTHEAVRRWNQDAYDRIVADRVSARRAVDPIVRFVRSTLAKELAAVPTTLTMPKPQLSYVALGSLPVQDLFALARTIQETPRGEPLSRYLQTRRALEPATLATQVDRRIVLFADLAVDLAVTKQSDAVRAEVARFVSESGRARREYAPLRKRTASLVASSDENRPRAITLVQSGLNELRALRQDDDVSIDALAFLEAEHQLFLRQAGNVVQVAEDLLAARKQDQDVSAVVVPTVRSMLYWAEEAHVALSELDALGALGPERYASGYLADATWLHQTPIIRHRALCAAATLAIVYPGVWRAAGIDERVAELRDGDVLNESYLALLSLPAPNQTQQLNTLQSSIWHSLLRGDLVPYRLERLNKVYLEWDEMTSPGDDHPSEPYRLRIFGASDRELAFARLLGHKWDAGAPEKIPRGSFAWTQLDTFTQGRFAAWRTHVAILRDSI